MYEKRTTLDFYEMNESDDGCLVLCQDCLEIYTNKNMFKVGKTKISQVLNHSQIRNEALKIMREKFHRRDTELLQDTGSYNNRQEYAQNTVQSSDMKIGELSENLNTYGNGTGSVLVDVQNCNKKDSEPLDNSDRYSSKGLNNDFVQEFDKNDDAVAENSAMLVNMTELVHNAVHSSTGQSETCLASDQVENTQPDCQSGQIVALRVEKPDISDEKKKIGKDIVLSDLKESENSVLQSERPHVTGEKICEKSEKELVVVAHTRKIKNKGGTRLGLPISERIQMYNNMVKMERAKLEKCAVFNKYDKKYSSLDVFLTKFADCFNFDRIISTDFFEKYLSILKQIFSNESNDSSGSNIVGSQNSDQSFTPFLWLSRESSKSYVNSIGKNLDKEKSIQKQSKEQINKYCNKSHLKSEDISHKNDSIEYIIAKHKFDQMKDQIEKQSKDMTGNKMEEKSEIGSFGRTSFSNVFFEEKFDNTLDLQDADLHTEKNANLEKVESKKNYNIKDLIVNFSESPYQDPLVVHKQKLKQKNQSKKVQSNKKNLSFTDMIQKMFVDIKSGLTSDTRNKKNPKSQKKKSNNYEWGTKKINKSYVTGNNSSNVKNKPLVADEEIETLEIPSNAVVQKNNILKDANSNFLHDISFSNINYRIAKNKQSKPIKQEKKIYDHKVIEDIVRPSQFDAGFAVFEEVTTQNLNEDQINRILRNNQALFEGQKHVSRMISGFEPETHISDDIQIFASYTPKGTKIKELKVIFDVDPQITPSEIKDICSNLGYNRNSGVQTDDLPINSNNKTMNDVNSQLNQNIPGSKKLTGSNQNKIQLNINSDVTQSVSKFDESRGLKQIFEPNDQVNMFEIDNQRQKFDLSRTLELKNQEYSTEPFQSQSYENSSISRKKNPPSDKSAEHQFNINTSNTAVYDLFTHSVANARISSISDSSTAHPNPLILPTQEPIQNHNRLKRSRGHVRRLIAFFEEIIKGNSKRDTGTNRNVHTN